MVRDGFPNSEEGSWIPGKERAERVLASADEVALQARHPIRVAWEVQAGDRRKDWRMVHGLFDVKRRGRQKVQKIGGRK